MRIISGKFKGRKILKSVDNSTRPLKDMVKESMFNIIEHSKLMNLELKNTNILDLYSGIGSFGLECLSRGAKKVFFFEKHLPTLDILKRNIEILDCKNNCEIVDSDVSNLEEFDKISNYQFDLVFLDPPYKDMNLNFILEKISKIKILKKHSFIIIHRNKNIIENYNNKLKVLRVENYGKSKIIFAKIEN